jgi:hypothetical protein
MIGKFAKTAPYAAVFCAAMANLTNAQDWGNYPSSIPPRDPDVLLMRESEEGHLAEVFYSNSASEASNGFNGVMEHTRDDGLTVQAHIRILIGGEDVDYAEIIEVTPVHPQHSAFPAGPIPVMDGEEIVIQIMLPMF